MIVVGLPRPYPFHQCFGPVEREHPAAAGVGIAVIGEIRLDAGGYIAERQWIAPGQRAQRGRQALAILHHLRLHAAQRRPGGLGFHDPDRPSLGEEHVIHLAGGQRKLAHRHARGRRAVHLLARLHLPAGRFEHPVDGLSGFIFGREYRHLDTSSYYEEPATAQSAVLVEVPNVAHRGVNFCSGHSIGRMEQTVNLRRGRKNRAIFSLRRPQRTRSGFVRKWHRAYNSIAG